VTPVASATAPRLPHIVIDGRELVGRPTGVGRYLMGLLTEWAARPAEARITVIVPGEVPAELSALAPPITIVKVRTGSTGTIFEQTVLPGAARRLRANVFFAPAYTAPLQLPCPLVVTIHDVSYFAHPEWFGWREGLRRRWFTKATVRRAAGITTVSEFSASELQRYLGIARDRIDVAPNGAPEAAANPLPASRRAPLVLYAGSIFARRGVPALVSAFAAVVKAVPDARLVLVGDNRTTPPIDPMALATAAGVGDRVDWRRYAPDHELRTLYAQARVFAFLSEYEGFAMTPMEAIAQGVPVVLRDTAIAREIYGDGAALVGEEPSVLAATLTSLLTDDRAHAELLARGRARLPLFTWAQSADIVMRTLLRAAGAS